MNDLTIGLGILGGLVLAAVVAHSAWTSRRNTPRQAEPAADTPPGATVADAAAISSASAKPATSATSSASSASGAPNGLQHAAAGGRADDGRSEPVLLEDAPPPPQDRRALLDPLIDSIASISLEGVISGDAVLAVMPLTRRAGSKPFLIAAQPEGSSDWEMPATGRRYSALQAGVQLANRNGPLNEIEYSEFVMKARTFADAIGGELQFAEMLEEVARARELDQFAVAHDAQLRLVLRPRGVAWSPGFVTQNAARVGFVAGVIPGRMVLPAPVVGAAPLVGLSFDVHAALADDLSKTAVRELALSLDVPQVPRTEQPFHRMCEAAQALIGALDAVLSDDAGTPIQPDALVQIGGELEAVYDRLDQRELSAGSMLARRLFS